MSETLFQAVGVANAELDHLEDAEILYSGLKNAHERTQFSIGVLIGLDYKQRKMGDQN